MICRFWPLIRLTFVFTLFSLQVSALEISSDIHSTKVDFIPHTSDTKYLSMNIPYNPVSELFEQFQSQWPQKLKNRGEAHITVVTPPEFSRFLKQYISIEEVHRLALAHKIQQSQFGIVCLGRGKNGSKNTFYIVVESEDLMDLRRAIYEFALMKGMPSQAWDPMHFFPHITLGFSHHDLHESHGIKKDSQTCYKDILVK